MAIRLQTLTTIWKFPLNIADVQKIELPIAHRPIHVGLDPKGNPCVWCEVEPASEKADFTFYIIGTGHPIPDDAEHVSSFLQPPFVWHFYRKVPR